MGVLRGTPGSPSRMWGILVDADMETLLGTDDFVASVMRKVREIVKVVNGCNLRDDFKSRF